MSTSNDSKTANRWVASSAASTVVSVGAAPAASVLTTAAMAPVGLPLTVVAVGVGLVTYGVCSLLDGLFD